MLLIVIGAVLNALQGGSNGPSTTTHARHSSTPSVALVGPHLYSVGQTMTNGAHQTVTVTSFAVNTSGSGYSTPPPGSQCVEVHVALFNGDSTPWDVPLLELAVVDASGQVFDGLSAVDCPSSGFIDSLVPGGRASAALYFEVPSSGRLVLEWTPSSLNPNSNYNTLLKAS